MVGGEKSREKGKAVEEYRYKTEFKQVKETFKETIKENIKEKEVQTPLSIYKQLQVTLRYKSNLLHLSFPPTATISSFKLDLFRQLLTHFPHHTDQILNLLTFQSYNSQFSSFIDYYLSESQPHPESSPHTLSLFTSNSITHLHLQPLFSPLATRSVSLTDFTPYQCIGVGGFSKVFLAKCKLNGKLCALKFISKEYIIKNKKYKLLQNEREILAGIDNPSIITLYHAFETKNYVVFSLEYCPNNQLYQYLKEKERLEEDEAREIFKEILLGVGYLHSKKVLYRDIKLENLLIDAEGHIKITDFGLSKPNCDENEVTYSYCGSPQYMAPEMLLKCGHSFEVDYYALGILLYELLVGISPFSAKTKSEIYYSAINHEVKFPKEVMLSKEVKALLVGLLNKNPNNRIGCEGGVKQIMEHPWIKMSTKGKEKAKHKQQNSFAGKIFKEYEQVRETDVSWLQREFEYEQGNYEKKFEHIYYQNIKIYKQRINDYLKLEQEYKKIVSRNTTGNTSPVMSRHQSRPGTPKGSNPFLKRLR